MMDPSRSSVATLAPVTFALTAEERISAVAGKVRLGATNRVPFFLNGAVYLVLGTFQLYGGFAGTVHGHRISSIYQVIGSVWLACGMMMLVFATNIYRVRRHLWFRSRETTFGVLEHAITIADPHARVVPWNRVRRITDLGEIFVIEAGLRRVLVPKRVFDDRGERFWKLATDRLVGRRLLAGARSRTVIVNTIAGRH